VPAEVRNEVMQTLRSHGLSKHSHFIGKPNDRGIVEVWRDTKNVFSAPLRDLHQVWDEVSWSIARLRDNPASADAEHEAAGRDDIGLNLHLSFDPADDVAAPFIHTARPRLAILREQGVNSQVEMSYAMALAGFDTHDVHMSDLQTGRARLDQFIGFVACGGFSYGDTLGAGEGWARSILFNPQLAEQFAAFFNRQDTFALGVCNGCQMMSNLRELRPCRPSSPARRRGRSSPATEASSLRPGSASSRFWTVRRSCSRAWRAAGCQWRYRMARVLPIFPSVAMQQPCTARCASSITQAVPPRPTLSIPTVAQGD